MKPGFPPFHIRHKRDLIVEGFPSLLIDALLNRCAIVDGADRGVTVAVLRAAGVRALSPQGTYIGVEVSIKRRAHIQLLGCHAS